MRIGHTVEHEQERRFLCRVEDFLESELGGCRIDNRDDTLMMLRPCHFTQALRIDDLDGAARRFGARNDVAHARPLPRLGNEKLAHRFRPLAQTRDDRMKAVKCFGRRHREGIGAIGAASTLSV